MTIRSYQCFSWPKQKVELPVIWVPFVPFGAIQEKLKEEQGVLEDKDGNQEVRRTVLAGERSDVLVQAREFLGKMGALASRGLNWGSENYEPQSLQFLR